jgi:Family of unknown function (DUF6328)
MPTRRLTCGNEASRLLQVRGRYLWAVSSIPTGVGDGASNPPSSPPDEDPDERLNRELIELLNELRVMLPGVQVLFAFLFTVPFSSRYAKLTDGQQAIYFATFVCTTIATGLFMVPTAYHRIRFRQGDKERILRTSNRFTIVGIAFLAISITLAFALISDLLFGFRVAIALGAVVLVFLGWAWFAIPLSRRVRDGD